MRRGVDYEGESGKVSVAQNNQFEPLTPGSEVDAWTNEETDIKNRYAKRMGIDGETLSHSQGALHVGQLVKDEWWAVSIRETEEEGGWQYNHNCSCNVHRPITCVLKSSAPEKSCVPSEVLVVFAKLPLHSLLGGLCPTKSR